MKALGLNAPNEVLVLYSCNASKIQNILFLNKHSPSNTKLAFVGTYKEIELELN